MLRRWLPGRRSRVEFEVSAASFETLALAAIAGLRAMAAPALLARAVRRGDLGGLRGTPLAALGSRKVSTALRLLMAGEMIADKTSVVPSRTSASALLGRALSGALVGATLFAAERRAPSSGAVLGILSAIAAAYAGERLRVEGARRFGAPDPALALLEDRLVLSLGPRLLRRRKT